MTPDALNAALEAMQASATDDGQKPGLITVQSDEWIERMSAMQSGRPKTIADGVRIRDIKVAVGANNETKVLTRAEAGERGEPYRDLPPA